MSANAIAQRAAVRRHVDGRGRRAFSSTAVEPAEATDRGTARRGCAATAAARARDEVEREHDERDRVDRHRGVHGEQGVRRRGSRCHAFILRSSLVGVPVRRSRRPRRRGRGPRRARARVLERHAVAVRDDLDPHATARDEQAREQAADDEHGEQQHPALRRGRGARRARTKRWIAAELDGAEAVRAGRPSSPSPSLSAVSRRHRRRRSGSRSSVSSA